MRHAFTHDWISEQRCVQAERADAAPDFAEQFDDATLVKRIELGGEREQHQAKFECREASCECGERIASGALHEVAQVLQQSQRCSSAPRSMCEPTSTRAHGCWRARRSAWKRSARP